MQNMQGRFGDRAKRNGRSKRIFTAAALLLTAALSTGYAQRLEVRAEPIVLRNEYSDNGNKIRRTYDGTTIADVTDVFFFVGATKQELLSGGIGRLFEVVSAEFDSPNVRGLDETHKATVKIRIRKRDAEGNLINLGLQNTFIVNENEDGIATIEVDVPNAIARASGNLIVRQDSDLSFGETPSPVVFAVNGIDTDSLAKLTGAVRDSIQKIFDGVTFRYALMNMDGNVSDDPITVPAWFEDKPFTDGLYIVQGMLEETLNFTADNSALTWFRIGERTTSILPNTGDVRKTGKIFIEKNPVTADFAEIKIVLPNGERVRSARLKILDALGNEVFNSEYGNTDTLVWNLNNSSGRKIAGGAYLALVSVVGESAKAYHYRTLIAVKGGNR